MTNINYYTSWSGLTNVQSDKSSVDSILKVLGIKGPKRVPVDIPDIEPGGNGEDGLEEEGSEGICLTAHQGYPNHSYNS